MAALMPRHAGKCAKGRLRPLEYGLKNIGRFWSQDENPQGQNCLAVSWYIDKERDSAYCAACLTKYRAFSLRFPQAIFIVSVFFLFYKRLNVYVLIALSVTVILFLLSCLDTCTGCPFLAVRSQLAHPGFLPVLS